MRLHTLHWGISTLLIATVTTTQTRIATMMENVPAMRESTQFLFKALTHEDLVAPALDILGRAWLRPGHSPICLDC